ncbi:alpha/beta fold hydrolase [Bacillus spongiae]|uniref:alpha/beta fold hydrolase n=1 Tax=Bacillus spongiae TaxID=2683610 RepID=UPI003AF9DA7D
MEKELFVQLRDVKLFTKIYGQKKDKPTVVMDAGYGDYSKSWDQVVTEVSQLTEVVVYDRAGLGRSEKSRNRRTSQEMVKELKELLTILNVDTPIILVGHSFGGINIRLFATKYPDDVAGLLLVDSTPEEYKERFLPIMSNEFQVAYHQQFIHESNYDEFMESLRTVGENKTTLDIPLMVLCAGKKDHYTVEAQELWNEMQAELVGISTNGQLVIANESGHFIQKDEPNIVIDAIKRLVKDA